MPSLLSQEEIDALASACRAAGTTGDNAHDRGRERTVRPYDFTRPDKFSKEHMRILNSIHSDYAAAFSTSLGVILRLPVQTEALAVEQMTFLDYTQSIPEDTIFFGVSLKPLVPTAIFEFNAAVAYGIIDGLTGGSGAPVSNPGPLTDIDRAILCKVLDILLKRYSEAWAPYMAITSAIDDDNRAGPLDQVFSHGDSMLVCGYEVSLGTVGGSMTVCIPAGAVESILPVLDANRSAETSPKHDPSVKQALQASLDEAALTCHAILGRATLTMEDVINLQTDDIIRLDAKSNSDIEFWVGDSHAFSATPGRSGRNMGIKITKVR